MTTIAHSLLATIPVETETSDFLRAKMASDYCGRSQSVGFEAENFNFLRPLGVYVPENHQNLRKIRVRLVRWVRLVQKMARNGYGCSLVRQTH